MSRALLRLLLLVVIAALPCARADAAPILVDLEAFSDGDALTNQIAGVTFANTTILTAGISLNEIDFPPASGVDVAVDDGGPVRIDFLLPVVSFSAHFTYVVPVQLRAFDAADNLLGVVTSAFSANYVSGGDPGSAPNEFLEAAFAGMAYLTLVGAPGGFSFVMDDLAITPVERVPEPGMLSLALLGVGASIARFTLSRRVATDRR